MTQKQNGVLEWLQSCETPAPSEPKIKSSNRSWKKLT